MKTLNFLYQETQIHFLINGTDQNVMVNATEMAKMYNKRTDHYLQNETTKTFIKALENRNEFPAYGGNKNQINQTLNGGRLENENENKVPDISGTLENKIIQNRGRNGIYFCELLAIDFATWLDVDFKIWVYTCIQEILFGNYKKHWEAHARQEQAKAEMQILKQQIITEPTSETVVAYFEAEKKAHKAKNDKSKAIANQLKLFPELEH